MLTQPPRTASPQPSPPPEQRPDDISGHRHRQVIGYLGLALPILLVLLLRLRPNAPSDQWMGNSISAYYWTGAVSLFVGILAALSLYLITYRGYANDSQKWDRRIAVIAGVAAAIVAIFPTTPPTGAAALPWWADWISNAHAVAAIVLFSMFAVFSLWLFRKSAPNEQPTPAKKRRNRIYLLCGAGIVVSMGWAYFVGQSGGSIFWPESLALIFFASSWLVKGHALRSIRSTLGAAKDTVTVVLVLALASIVPNAVQAQGASSSHPDSVLRSVLVRIQTNVGASGFHSIRVATRAAGRLRGHDLLPRGDTVVLIDRSSERAIALADIDSVWVQRDFGRGLAIVGGAVCALIGGALGGTIAADPDSGDASVVGGILIGGTLFGAICGAGGWLVGDLIRTWRLEYVRPVESST